MDDPVKVETTVEVPQQPEIQDGQVEQAVDNASGEPREEGGIVMHPSSTTISEGEDPKEK